MSKKMSFSDRSEFSFVFRTGHHACDDLVVTSCQEVVEGQIIDSSKLVPVDSHRFDGMSFRDFSLDNVLAVDGLLDSQIMVNRNRVSRNNILLSQLDSIDLSKFVNDAQEN